MVLRKQAHRLIEGDEIRTSRVQSDFNSVEINALSNSITSDPLMVSGPIQQDPPHSFDSGRKEVTAGIAVLFISDIHESNVCLMHQRCGLQSLPRLLASLVRSSQYTQLFVDYRQQLLCPSAVPSLDGRQDLRNLAYHSQNMVRTVAARFPKRGRLGETLRCPGVSVADFGARSTVTQPAQGDTAGRIIL